MTLSKVVGDLQIGDKKVTLNHLGHEFRRPEIFHLEAATRHDAKGTSEPKKY